MHTWRTMKKDLEELACLIASSKVCAGLDGCQHAASPALCCHLGGGTR